MSSTADRPANSRWRPTLPEPYRSPVVKGMAWRYVVAYAGMAVTVIGGEVIGAVYRHAPLAARVDALTDVLIVYGVATGAAIALSWRWAWRAATAEAGGIGG